MNLFRVGAKYAGKKMGGQVRGDVRAAERAARYRGDEFHDLITKDSGVSASWIEKLIGQSKSADQLEKVQSYMNDYSRSGNIPDYVRKGLWRKLADKAEVVERQEFVQALMQNKDKVKKLLDMLNDIM